MTIYYVATLAQYVLVEAANETTAALIGAERIALLSTPVREASTIQIRTIRQATTEEIEFDAWHQAQVDASRQ